MGVYLIGVYLSDKIGRLTMHNTSYTTENGTTSADRGLRVPH
jgi:hypothetical protein